ncbi:MAG: monooxygenase [Lentilactobacillus diolivorans]|uniref:monooxygenase n=1 Tax=Lentilactobacillus diolivorans TaxID=179838 RepID=UPI0039ECF91B
MKQQIAITFGNEQILSTIRDKYPDRHLVIYQALNQQGKMMILDYSGKESIFKSPVYYDILGHTGADKWEGFISFSTLDLNFDQQKVFDARLNKLMSDGLPIGMHSIYSLNYHKDISQRVILGTWDSYSNFEIWKNSSHEFIPKEYRDSPSFYSHEAYYTPAEKKEAE